MTVLAANVYVLTEEGETRFFEAGSTPPKWAAEQITNPHAWAGEDAEPETATDPEPTPEPAEVKIPAVSGPGSSAKAWAAYAAAQGFEVDEDAKAADIRQALADAGIPTE